MLKLSPHPFFSPPPTPKNPLTIPPFQRNPPIHPHLNVLVMHRCHFSTLELFGLPYPADMTETDLFSSQEPLEPDHTGGLPVMTESWAIKVWLLAVQTVWNLPYQVYDQIEWTV